jgi:nitrate/nitrite-specific signal transduction histidine kinase
MVILFAGGVSVFLGVRIHQINKELDAEHAHALEIGEIYLRFHHILSEIQQIQATGKFNRAGRIRGLQHDLNQALHLFTESHRQEENSPDEALEEAILDNLSRIEADLRTFADRAAVRFEEGRLIGSEDLEQLSQLVDRGTRSAQELNRFHRARVIRMAEESQGLDRLSVTVYLAFLVIAGLLVALASLTLRRTLAVPLVQVGRAALRIAEGRLEERVPVGTRDEIGQLSHSFNVMAERLQARERELRAVQERLQRKLHEMEVLNEIGSGMLRLGGKSGRDTILRSIVEKARDLLSVDATAICLTTPGPETLVVHSTSGPDEAFRLRQGVARRPAALDARDQHAMADCPVIRPEFARSHLAMPLQYGGEFRGVLCVAANGERVFGSDEIELLRAVSAQAAIALEHFRLDSEVQRLAVLEERGRIAREMHDGLAQTVSLLHLRIRQAQAAVSRETFSPLGNALDEMAAISGDMYEEIRRSIAGLRTPASQDLGLVPAISGFLKEFSAQARLPVDLTAEGIETVRLSPASDFEVIRIVQEALNNVRKHAQVKRARVLLECKDGCLRVSVQDDGRGFDYAQFATPDGAHFGLQGMRERVKGLGGTLEVVTAPGQGTSVIVLLSPEKTS